MKASKAGSQSENEPPLIATASRVFANVVRSRFSVGSVVLAAIAPMASIASRTAAASFPPAIARPAALTRSSCAGPQKSHTTSAALDAALDAAALDAGDGLGSGVVAAVEPEGGGEELHAATMAASRAPTRILFITAPPLALATRPDQEANHSHANDQRPAAPPAGWDAHRATEGAVRPIARWDGPRDPGPFAVGHGHPPQQTLDARAGGSDARPMPTVAGTAPSHWRDRPALRPRRHAPWSATWFAWW
jgi:hypothetical protein